MRIAVGGLQHETNTFSPLRTRLGHFWIDRGEVITDAPFWKRYRQRGIELLPTLSASASPHGLVERGAYEAIKGELIERLAGVLPVDGVYLDLHGAMEVETIGDGESDLVSAIRDVVGPDICIAASLDLHGNIGARLVQQTNVLTALRTAPHRDGEQTRARALDLLIRSLAAGLRPVTTMVKLPLLLPGEFAVTDAEPARALYAGLEALAAQPGVLDASLMISCAWTDSPETGASAIVVAESDPAIGRRVALVLARRVWDQRTTFGPEVETATVDEAISRARSSPEPSVFLSDAGDNVTAGGAGDLPYVLERLLAAHVPDAVVAGIADAPAVSRCTAAGVGGHVSLSIGGTLSGATVAPVRVNGTVAHLDAGDRATQAVVTIEGVDVILTSDRRAFTTPGAFHRAGIDPLKHKIVVVKLGYLFPELRNVAPRAMMMLSPGCTDLHIERLPYARIRRPVYPLERDVTWEAG